jgi:hypothetical protein
MSDCILTELFEGLYSMINFAGYTCFNDTFRSYTCDIRPGYRFILSRHQAYVLARDQHASASDVTCALVPMARGGPEAGHRCVNVGNVLNGDAVKRGLAYGYGSLEGQVRLMK